MKFRVLVPGNRDRQAISDAQVAVFNSGKCGPEHYLHIVHLYGDEDPVAPHTGLIYEGEMPDTPEGQVFVTRLMAAAQGHTLENL